MNLVVVVHALDPEANLVLVVDREVLHEIAARVEAPLEIAVLNIALITVTINSKLLVYNRMYYILFTHYKQMLIIYFANYLF